MKKLTELQVLKALDILHFQDIPENRADLQRVSKVLQYAPTEPGVPLSEDEWNEFCRACGNDPEAWGWARIRLNCILAKRNTAQPASQCVGYPDCDGDLPGEGHSTGCPAAHNLAERAMSAFLQAGHFRPEEAGRSRKEVDAVIRLVQQDSNARWEKALRDHPGPAISEQEIEWVRARIEANPQTLEERIAELEHQLLEAATNEIKARVVIVRPTQSELYDRAWIAFNFLRPVNIGCKDSPQNDAWDELAWCLINLKPKEVEDAPPPRN